MRKVKITGNQFLQIFDSKDWAGSVFFREALEKLSKEALGGFVKIFFIETEKGLCFCFQKPLEKDILQIDHAFELAYYYAVDKELSVNEITRFEGVIKLESTKTSRFNIKLDDAFIPSGETFQHLVDRLEITKGVKYTIPLVTGIRSTYRN